MKRVSGFQFYVFLIFLKWLFAKNSYCNNYWKRNTSSYPNAFFYSSMQNIFLTNTLNQN